MKQARHYLHPYRVNPHAIVHDVAAFTGLRVPFLRPRRRRPGSVWACSLVKDEIDVIDLTLDHLLRQGVTDILVADNGSHDGTLERLKERARADDRIHVCVDRDGRFFQAAKMTRLAQVAALAGADWIVPFDADELWFAPHGTLAAYLAGSSADRLTAEMFNVLPQPSLDPAGGEPQYLVDSRPNGWTKVAFRAHPLARVGSGNHSVDRVGTQESGLLVAHLAFRSADQMYRKIVQGAAALDAPGISKGDGYQWRWGAELDEAALRDVWLNVAAGRPEPRIDWSGLRAPREAALETWQQWEGALGENSLA